MHSNILSRTRNHNWVPNRLTTCNYSTNDRLDNILNRSIIYGYVRLAYDVNRVLILRDIKEDLDFEINDLRNSSMTKEGIYESEHDGMEVESTKLHDILSICDMLIGNTESGLDIEVSDYIKPSFELAIVEYYNMVYNKVDEIETVKSIDNVYIKGLKRDGMSIRLISQPDPHTMRSVVILNSANIQDMSIPNIIDFMSCVSFINASTDNYLAWLGSLCIEPDKNMMQGVAAYAPYDFVQKWFTPMKIADAIHSLAVGDRIKESVLATPDLRKITQLLVKLKERQGVGLGRCTYRVLKAALGASNYIDKDIAYVLEVLTSKNTETEEDDFGVDQEKIDAFKSSDLYVPSLDVTSEAFIQVNAKEDETPPEDEEEEEEEPAEDPPKEEEPPAEEEEPLDEPTEGEDDLDEDDPDDVEPEEDTTPKVVSETSDNKGIEITIQSTEDTLDEYLYRREVGYVIAQLLENPPEKLSAEKLAILKDIKTHWLHIFDVKTIHETLSKIIDLKIKVKTKEVA